jgi:hypothetical protein
MSKAKLQEPHSAYGQLHSQAVSSTERRWAWIRFSLGMMQMFGVVCSITLLVETGVSKAVFIIIVITGLLTTISILLFGARRSKP